MTVRGMGRGLALALLGACLAGPGVARSARIGVDPARFSMAYLRSDQTDWMWAAGMEQILRYNGLQIKQEEIARRVFGTNPDGSTRTNDALGLQDVITTCMKRWTVDDRGISFTAAAVDWKGVPSAQVLLAEFQAQRPILAMLRLPEGQQYLIGAASQTAVDVVIIDAGDYAPEPDGSPKFNSIEIRDPAATRKDPTNAGFERLTPLQFKSRVMEYWTIRIER
jgi:hypothetical protein